MIRFENIIFSLITLQQSYRLNNEHITLGLIIENAQCCKNAWFWFVLAQEKSKQNLTWRVRFLGSGVQSIYCISMLITWHCKLGTARILLKLEKWKPELYSSVLAWRTPGRTNWFSSLSFFYYSLSAVIMMILIMIMPMIMMIM